MKKIDQDNDISKYGSTLLSPDEIELNQKFLGTNGKTQNLQTVDDWLDAYYEEYIAYKKRREKKQ